ncbi:hypothetical protein B0H94_105219 [Salsuginibacillus halophilus]|uniref:Uncharacterized protein n=1 Tax=Salsuginibacillus halophilus TaxID=517424 RepID=A0A2P8HLH8_9BACI|nr:hypothetical protein [Salsuginibacillus halophilus]PSL47063.1 hypothetical protein B0H94_105219 [Salsuginibacillus halophilus]
MLQRTFIFSDTTERRNPDIQYFEASLAHYQNLLNKGSALINQLTSSPDLMQQLMAAAEVNDKEEVERIINSLQIDSAVEVSYTPTSVTFKMDEDAETFGSCCKLTMNLQWGRCFSRK